MSYISGCTKLDSGIKPRDRQQNHNGQKDQILYELRKFPILVSFGRFINRTRGENKGSQTDANGDKNHQWHFKEEAA